MSPKKKTTKKEINSVKVVPIKCSHCNKEISILEKDYNEYWNWKCPDCGEIFKLKNCTHFSWKCSRPDTPRRNPKNAR